MPQRAFENARPAHAGAVRGGAFARAAGFAAGFAGTRAVLGGLAGLALCCMQPAWAQEVTSNQVTSGQIYIPGPGDRSGADAASMTALIAAPSRVSATTPVNRANGVAPVHTGGAVNTGPATASADAEGSSANGMITIPGPGERGAAASAASVKIVTLPAPGTNPADVARPAPATTGPALAAARYAPPVRTASGALPRAVNVSAAATRVTPVVVEAAPAAGRTAAVAAPTAAAMFAGNSLPRSPQVPAGQQDGESIRSVALAFLQQQSVGLPGHVTITVAPVFSRGLAACASLEPFMPPGARTWGHTTVGVRCFGDHPWTLYVQARIAVDVTYYLAARQIGPGDTLSAADLLPRTGDLASLPQTVITDPSQAIGAVSLARIASGLPLRTDMLRSASSVIIGQTVRVIAVGTNFTISSEGSALNNAAPGEQVRVRTAGGQIITGVVKDAGTVQVQI